LKGVVKAFSKPPLKGAFERPLKKNGSLRKAFVQAVKKPFKRTFNGLVMALNLLDQGLSKAS
jgi:hypothetical protein